jgi:putative transposase
LEGAIHHVYARGNNRGALFVDHADRLAYLELVGKAVTAFEWLCLAYCLMDTHVHLLIETRRANLGAGVQRAHSRYAQLFNARHGRSGHVFQGRYGAVRVTTDAQLHAVAEYIDRNPVDAGVARSASRWPWSSAGARADGRPPRWLAPHRLAELRAAAPAADGEHGPLIG